MVPYLLYHMHIVSVFLPHNYINQQKSPSRCITGAVWDEYSHRLGNYAQFPRVVTYGEARCR